MKGNNLFLVKFSSVLKITRMTFGNSGMLIAWMINTSNKQLWLVPVMILYFNNWIANYYDIQQWIDSASIYSGSFKGYKNVQKSTAHIRLTSLVTHTSLQHSIRKQKSQLVTRDRMDHEDTLFNCRLKTERVPYYQLKADSTAFGYNTKITKMSHKYCQLNSICHKQKNIICWCRYEYHIDTIWRV